MMPSWRERGRRAADHVDECCTVTRMRVPACRCLRRARCRLGAAQQASLWPRTLVAPPQAA